MYHTCTNPKTMSLNGYYFSFFVSWCALFFFPLFYVYVKTKDIKAKFSHILCIENQLDIMQHIQLCILFWILIAFWCCFLTTTDKIKFKFIQWKTRMERKRGRQIGGWGLRKREWEKERYKKIYSTNHAFRGKGIYYIPFSMQV